MKEKLRLYRIRNHMTQQQLAEKSGVSLSTIHKIESGKLRNPRLDVVAKLSEALNVSADKIFF